MRPMLATLAPTIPTGPEWMHEIKWDGMRVLATVTAGELTLRSRTDRDVTSSFPELTGVAGIAPDVVLDGEVVVLRDGVPSFAALGQRMHVVTPSADLVTAWPVTYVIFDLLGLDGLDTTPLPLTDRRALLERLDLAGPHWHLSPVFDDGAALLAATREQGLEGVVSKRRDSRYEPGVRSSSWLKRPHRQRDSYVVGGWRPESTGSPRLGAVLLGTPTPDGLRFRGRMGSGLVGAAGERLHALLQEAPGSPFTDVVPRADAVGTRWVRPDVVIDVESLGLAADGRLRHPTFQGVRADLTAEDLLHQAPDADGKAADPLPVERPGAAPARRAGAARVSNPDKVMYPATGTTKAQVVEYYERVAHALLPELADRPVTRVRWPHGVGGPHFFEKNVPKGLSEQIERVTLPAPGSTKDRELVTYPLLRTVEDLVVIANLGALELHTPQWRVADGVALNPDRLVVDLDPGPPAGLAECARVALLVRARLADVGLDCLPVTSGSKGLQLYAPLDGAHTSEEAREIARALAELLTAEHPDLVLANMKRDLRPGKVLLDWSQNTAHKTTITPWSLRGRERPCVACPRTWDEVEAGAAGEPFEQVLFTDALDRLP